MKTLTLVVLSTVLLSYAYTQDTLRFTSVQMIRSAPGWVDNITRVDPLEASIVEGRWSAPHPGDSIRYNDTLTARWTTVRADSAGWYDTPLLRRAYVYATVTLDHDATYLLASKGNEMAYVNGVPRSGNPYAMQDTYESWETHFDFSLLPVRLHAGTNEFLFQCRRERFKALLLPVSHQVMINGRDFTKPDFIMGRSIDAPTGVVIINASEKPLTGATLDLRLPGGLRAHDEVPVIQPMSVRKVPFTVKGHAPEKRGELRGVLSLRRGSAVLDTVTIAYRVVDTSRPRRETFISEVDGSVQFYAVLEPSSRVRPTALIFSLHGAGVDALNQAASYEPKPWAMIVSPTNRRPYGFNWEDWGRLDAIEVFDRVKKEFPIDESRVYLTGHSMGGHGTYHIGSLFPDRFGAIGPSAGWVSFWSYRVREGFPEPTPMRAMLMRAALPSVTETLAVNYRRLGVYILHGSDDDNVFPGDSRHMAKLLAGFHKDFIYDERPGVGHWWDLSDAPGSDCVDWPPMMDFFARHARPTAWRERTVQFATPRPGVTADCDWLRIEAQTSPCELSSASLLFEPGVNRVSGTTVNIARLSFELSAFGSPDTLRVIMDGCTVAPTPTHGMRRVWFERTGSTWSASSEPSTAVKGPQRDGTFKDLFRHHFILVYGTRGTGEENRWSFDKTRYDAERFWYQGNGSAEVIADTALRVDAAKNRNIILYGNASTNAAWGAVMGDSPVQVTSDAVIVGGKTYTGRDLACLVLRPKAGTDAACVGAVGATGITGMRLTDRMPYLLPGVAFPDLLVCRASVLTAGEQGVELAGFFGNDWSLERGEFAKKAD